MTYLLDSNVCISYLRGQHRTVRNRLMATPTCDVFLCSVVKAELFAGAMKSIAPQSSLAIIDQFVLPYPSLPFDDSAARQFGSIRRVLELLGLPIGPYDMQIAAIAMANGCTLVTHNTREFSRIPNLVLEDWQLP